MASSISIPRGSVEYIHTPATAAWLMVNGIAAAVLTACLALVGPSVTAATPHYAKPCVYKNSHGPCVYDAKHMGNGKGRSFRRFANDKVKYISHRHAHRLLGLP